MLVTFDSGYSENKAEVEALLTSDFDLVPNCSLSYESQPMQVSWLKISVHGLSEYFHVCLVALQLVSLSAYIWLPLFC